MNGKTVSVDELIQLLAKHPPDLRVMVHGYEEGYDDLEADSVVVGETPSLKGWAALSSTTWV